MGKGMKILIVESNVAVRSRLMDAIKSALESPVLDTARKLTSAIEKLSGPAVYDLVITRSTKDIGEIRNLVSACEKSRESNPPLLLVSLKGSEQESTYVAQLYLAGVHGLLCEPFSSDRVLEAIATARERASQDQDQGKQSKRAAGFLTTDALKLIDQIAESKIAGRGIGYEMRDLKELRKSIGEIAANVDPASFVDMVSAKVKDAKPSGRVFKTKPKAAKPKEAVHPGHHVQIALQARGITEEKLLSITAIAKEELDAIIAQTIPLSDAAAREISRALGKTAKYWLKLQSDFDEYREFIKQEEAKK